MVKGKFLPMPSRAYAAVSFDYLLFLGVAEYGFSTDSLKNFKILAFPERIVKQAVSTLKLPAQWRVRNVEEGAMEWQPGCADFNKGEFVT